MGDGDSRLAVTITHWPSQRAVASRTEIPNSNGGAGGNRPTQTKRTSLVRGIPDVIGANYAA